MDSEIGRVVASRRGPVYYLGATPLEMLVDPALVGKRVRVTIEALPDETVGAKEVVTGVS